MDKPKCKIINCDKDDGWSKTEQVGYNQACDDWQAWLDSVSVEKIEVIILKGISYANTPFGGKQKEQRASEIAKEIKEELL